MSTHSWRHLMDTETPTLSSFGSFDTPDFIDEASLDMPLVNSDRYLPHSTQSISATEQVAPSAGADRYLPQGNPSAPLTEQTSAPSTLYIDRPTVLQKAGSIPRVAVGQLSTAKMSPPTRSTRRNSVNPSPFTTYPHDDIRRRGQEVSSDHEQRFDAQPTTVLYARQFESLMERMARLEEEMHRLRSLNIAEIFQRLDHLGAFMEKEYRKLYGRVDELQSFIDMVKADAEKAATLTSGQE